MAESSLRTLNDYYHWVLSSYQSFDMCLHDLDSIARDMRVGYGFDGYDLCMLILPPTFWDRPSPHHGATRDRWQAFFDQSDGNVTFAIISPLAVLELLATVREYASGDRVFRLLCVDHEDTQRMLRELGEGLRAFEEISGTEEDIIDKLMRLVSITRNARDILLRGGPFETLSLLLDGGKLKLLDPILRSEVPPPDLVSLLKLDQVHFARGLKYLRDKRSPDFSQYREFYNNLDILHYVLFDNAHPVLQARGIEPYIASSGILTRNSWILTEYGKFLDDLDGIPSDWSGRSSDAPSFLTRALQDFSGDLRQAQYFFDESRALARIILRDLQEVPEIRDCLYDRRRRKRLLHQNPTVKVRNHVPPLIQRFHNSYYSKLAPQFRQVPFAEGEMPREIDFEALYEWITNPETRSQEFGEVAEQVRRQMDTLRLNPLDWSAYIAPLGSSSYEILSAFYPHLDR